MTASYWKQVREAEAKATPGPWVPRKEEYDSHAEMSEALAKTISHGGHVLHYIGHQDPIFPAMTGNGPTSKANAEFIAIAREAVPKALSRIEELEAALTEIASCHSLAPGDVVDIARAALGKP